MAKIIVKGFTKNHKAIVERHTTPGLVTDLIARYEKMCVAEIYHALEDIRRSAEDDLSRSRMYLKLRIEENEKRKQKEKEQDEYEKSLVTDGIDAAKRLMEGSKDMSAALVIFRLCKYIAGDRLELKLEMSDKAEG